MLRNLMNTMAGQGKDHEEQCMDREAYRVGRDLKIKPLPSKGNQPARPRIELSWEVRLHHRRS
jgi:hypothetical protein